MDKAGYRGKHHLWNRHFLDHAGRPHRPSRRFKATDTGTDQWRDFCFQHGVNLAVMEAAGGYERDTFARLWAAGLPVATPRLQFNGNCAREVRYEP